MKLFVKGSETDKYVITIKNVMRYELALDHVVSGMSFRQDAMTIEHAKRHTQMPKLAGIKSLMVGQFIRALVASNLQQIADFMPRPSGHFRSRVMAAHIAASRSLTCVRDSARDVLANLHLVAIPMFDRHAL